MAYDTFLKIGAEVEVTSPDHTLRGTLFPAKIVGKGSVDTKFLVEYTTLEAQNDDGERLREEVELVLLRPLPPRERNYAFSFGDNVDAFFGGGWWEGAITEILDGSKKFGVYFRFAKQQFEFGKSCLRLHREWVKGNWVPPLLEKNVSVTEEAKARTRSKLHEGTRVEVCSDEDGLQGAWFAATIVKVVGKDTFLVQYETLKTEDETEFLTEEADRKNMRPYPPEAVKGFKLNDKVDALYNDGWWEGVICKVLRGGRYRVYFEGTGDYMNFDPSELRPHQDWIDETWVMSSQL
ncbi:protein AGENET DOMAIN (AGD)-CONTAINING P1 [Ziziphus jujuba]|uniref:Protein AGENET DOMAIN (AGD)-CONTAINING P1 n=1 Tax=Ziziphus jujuba TaxID=326968 RepID=A0A6P3ZBA9_ZIZJJ|nr:protein AGENET DOMAIN (AGD)-CONTAINING P1 [Ziziphus jujuba]